MKPFAPLLCALLMLTGCTSIASHKNPTVKLDQIKRIYVEHRLAEENGMDRLIAEELVRLGYDASCGPLTMMPEKVDALLSYEERWGWDFRSYLIELRVELKDLKTPPTQLSVVRCFRPALANALTPQEMVQIALRRLLDRKPSK